ncbi:MAG: tRNA (adenosine(37)-N6)-threonylcarbamoyltransferase complex dimerization subunit type 1 TsaB [Roseiflexaceae bacterium]|nr:tRNA (adenosine(37)-N6)-threonylcarbamoyltransferase complex dimerization subunit type 1 TsaB [Roseiflexaceae bacterium]
MLLAIDTTTSFIGLACYEADALLGECSWFSGRNQTVQLLPQLELLLQHLGRRPQDVRAVAVALGPGSWSGLRVGMSTAKGFAIARDLPLFGIGTLDALAYQHYRPGLVICPLIRLGRDRFAAARFEAPPAPPFATPVQHVSIDELGVIGHGETLFCGDLDDSLKVEIIRTNDKACFPTSAANARRPGYLAELAWQRWQHGAPDNRATLEPIYLGNPVKTVPNTRGPYAPARTTTPS